VKAGPASELKSLLSCSPILVAPWACRASDRCQRTVHGLRASDCSRTRDEGDRAGFHPLAWPWRESAPKVSAHGDVPGTRVVPREIALVPGLGGGACVSRPTGGSPLVTPTLPRL
jgi:hypothetical protein